jgi:hypothetical protein
MSGRTYIPGASVGYVGRDASVSQADSDRVSSLSRLADRHVVLSTVGSEFLGGSSTTASPVAFGGLVRLAFLGQVTDSMRCAFALAYMGGAGGVLETRLYTKRTGTDPRLIAVSGTLAEFSSGALGRQRVNLATAGAIGPGSLVYVGCRLRTDPYAGTIGVITGHSMLGGVYATSAAATSLRDEYSLIDGSVAAVAAAVAIPEVAYCSAALEVF